ncbi:Methyltransferase type 12 [Penicillium sp. DV-2018c]|nr:Methyltransferase type 12 [Penicillium sp. DV-2018c]KAJ5582893.1 Methyltransferase type 12 [Penicillium sp. DV-2018c]
MSHPTLIHLLLRPLFYSTTMAFLLCRFRKLLALVRMRMRGCSHNIYLLGRDEEESARAQLDRPNEINSLNTQHRFFVNLSNLIHPSIPKDITAIADLGTGTGIWLEDVSKSLPNKSVYLHGFDISSAQFPPGHEIRRPGQKPISLSIHNVLHPFPKKHHGKYDLVHIRLLTAGLKKEDYPTVLASARALLRPNGWIQWEELDDTAYCTDAIPEPAAITSLRQSLRDAMLKLGMWPFATQLVYDEISADGFADVVRETYTTLGKDHLRATAQRWVAGSMRALVPASMVVTGEAKDEDEAREIVEELIGQFEAHCQSARALVNLGRTVGRRVD